MSLPPTVPPIRWTARLRAVLAVVVVLAVAVAFGFQLNGRNPLVTIDPARIELGERPEGDVIETNVVVRNASERDVHFNRIQVDCSCLTLWENGKLLNRGELTVPTRVG